MTKPSNKRKKRKKGGSNSDVDPDSSVISNEYHKPENGCAQEQTTSKDAEGDIPVDMEKFAKDLIEQFDKKIEEYFKKFDKDFAELFETRLTNFTKIVTKLSEDHNSVVDDVKAVSFKADKNEEHILRLEEEIAKRDEKLEDMLNEIDDLRNRGMRKTVIIKDTWINARSFLSSFFENHDLNEIEIDRVHRSAKKVNPASSQSSTSRKFPRPFFAELLTWQDCNEILQKANEIGKKTFTFNRQSYRVIIEQLVSKKVHKEKQDALQVRKSFLSEQPEWKITVKYPAKLMIKKTQNEHYRRHRITEHELKQAKDFIKTINK